MKGLGLQVTEGGTKNYVMRYKTPDGRKHQAPPALTEAALYALADKPKPSEGARPDSHRKTVIVETVEELKGILGTYAAAYETVADRLEWADAESVRAPWRGARARRRLPRRSRPH